MNDIKQIPVCLTHSKCTLTLLLHTYSLQLLFGFVCFSLVFPFLFSSHPLKEYKYDKCLYNFLDHPLVSERMEVGDRSVSLLEVRGVKLELRIIHMPWYCSEF